MVAYKVICPECSKESKESLIYGYMLYWSENHMMETGHIITEIDIKVI